MLKFSNEDYCTPRERAQYMRSGGYRESTENNTFGCDGSRNAQGYDRACGGVAVPKTCGHHASLAMVYPPVQEYTDLFDSVTALCNGTLFRALCKPLGV